MNILPDPGIKGVLHDNVGEITRLHYEGQVRGITAALVLHDGTVRTLIALGEGSTMLALAGIVMMQTDVMQNLQTNSLRDAERP